MKIKEPFSRFPDQIKNLIRDSAIVEIHLGCSNSQVFKVSRSPQGSFYLKLNEGTQHAPLLHEVHILQWLQGKLRVPEVVEYVKDEKREYVVLTEVPGINCLDAMVTLDYSQIVVLLAEGLREIHQVDISQCPFDESLKIKLANAQLNLALGLVDEDDFDLVRQGKTAQEVMELLCQWRPTEDDYVFSHGDYCLPNIILQNNQVRGYIDLGRAGVSDRYNDLAIASRSIRYNLGEAYETQFFMEYGVDSIDAEKLMYYRMLDEMF